MCALAIGSKPATVPKHSLPCVHSVVVFWFIIELAYSQWYTELLTLTALSTNCLFCVMNFAMEDVCDMYSSRANGPDLPVLQWSGGCQTKALNNKGVEVAALPIRKSYPGMLASISQQNAEPDSGVRSLPHSLPFSPSDQTCSPDVAFSGRVRHVHYITLGCPHTVIWCLYNQPSLVCVVCLY